MQFNKKWKNRTSSYIKNHMKACRDNSINYLTQQKGILPSNLHQAQYMEMKSLWIK